ncbi:lipid droplet assembly factor 1-like [Betta splendens]|uniref:Lipid droplet assembly factor 1-like n=1 Tax=Betta splendens TaxID=158456 RepID=A0A6P7N6K9_BETSP|nr:lipid droplet assembly factor 1-like [Betta splendens]XP_055367006.1 lipid droplet assembly factor 1-like [Betta splendens]XP_055367007.1 lipid droplet assembly factor 1-like [Betta splendens]
MEPHSSSSGSSSSGRDGGRRSSSFQQLRAKWSDMLSRVYDDPRVARVTGSTAGRYLRSHPGAALTAVVFGLTAAGPVGLFLAFAVVSAAGFVFCEVALLLAAGLILMSVLCGLAFFAVLLSIFLNASYFISFSLLKCYSDKKQQRKAEEESDGQTSCKGKHVD